MKSLNQPQGFVNLHLNYLWTVSLQKYISLISTEVLYYTGLFILFLFHICVIYITWNLIALNV